jgi:hypothetical protein
MANSDEMIKLIDIAINSGLQLSSLNQNQLLKLFLSVDETKWKIYLDTDTIESLQKAKTLYANNEEISKTVNPRFLSDEVTSHFSKTQIEILSCYPKLQDRILKLSSNGQKAEIIYQLVDKYKDNLEWIPILEKALDNVNSSEFANLLASINDKELSLFKDFPLYIKFLFVMFLISLFFNSFFFNTEILLFFVILDIKKCFLNLLPELIE